MVIGKKVKLHIEMTRSDLQNVDVDFRDLRVDDEDEDDEDGVELGVMVSFRILRKHAIM